VFSAGIDVRFLQDALSASATEFGKQRDVGYRALLIRAQISKLQQCVSAIEACAKPVIVAVHGACMGAALDIATAADIRYCTQDAYFSVNETNLALTADLGKLQRLPYIVGSAGWVREISYTGRRVPAQEALQMGLVARVFDNQAIMLQGALDLAKVIASKSSLAVQGIKTVLQYSAEHTVQEGLDFVANFNAFAAQSQDLAQAVLVAQKPRHRSKL